MGKGVVVENINNKGLYNVDIIYNTTKFDKLIQEMQQKLLVIQTQSIPDSTTARNDQIIVKGTASSDLDIAIANLSAFPFGSPGYEAALQNVKDKTRIYNIESLTLSNLESVLVALNVEETGLRVEINYIGSKKVETKKLAAWSLDYNIAYPLGTEVGTIEIPGEIKGNEVWIKPGGVSGNGSVYSSVVDGQITQGWGMHSSEVFFALAITPGWQRWRPQFRIGTIIFKDVVLDKVQVSFNQAENSNSEGFYGIPEGSLTLIDVSCDYMGSGCGIFEVGDKVIVKFDPASDADILAHTYTGKVVGFRENPKPLGIRMTLNKWLDGTPYDLPLSPFIYFKIFNSSNVDVTSDFSWTFVDPGGGADTYYQLSPTNLSAVDNNGYWVEYKYDTDGTNINDAANWRFAWLNGKTVGTQYPFIHAGDLNNIRNVADLIKLGEEKTDNIHYVSFESFYGYRQIFDSAGLPERGPYLGFTHNLQAGEPWGVIANHVVSVDAGGYVLNNFTLSDYTDKYVPSFDPAYGNYHMESSNKSLKVTAISSLKYNTTFQGIGGDIVRIYRLVRFTPQVWGSPGILNIDQNDPKTLSLDITSSTKQEYTWLETNNILSGRVICYRIKNNPGAGPNEYTWHCDFYVTHKISSFTVLGDGIHNLIIPSPPFQPYGVVVVNQVPTLVAGVQHEIIFSPQTVQPLSVEGNVSGGGTIWEACTLETSNIGTFPKGTFNDNSCPGIGVEV